VTSVKTGLLTKEISVATVHLIIEISFETGYSNSEIPLKPDIGLVIFYGNI